MGVGRVFPVLLALTPTLSPFAAEPWMHVGCFFLGGYVGQRWVRLEKELVIDINQIRADKGMPPMVATDVMLGLKYQKP